MRARKIGAEVAWRAVEAVAADARSLPHAASSLLLFWLQGTLPDVPSCLVLFPSSC